MKGITLRSDSASLLSSQELYSIELAAQGLDITESAAIIFKSKSRVKQLRNAVIEKLETKNLTHAVAILIVNKNIILKSSVNICSSPKLKHNEILSLYFAAQGFNVKETSIKLCRCKDRIKQLRANAIKILNAKNMSHAIAIAITEGIVKF